MHLSLVNSLVGKRCHLSGFMQYRLQLQDVELFWGRRMVNDAERPGDFADGGIVARLLPILVAFGPPVAVSGWLWSKVQENVAVSVLVLIGYWFLVAVTRFVFRVSREVGDLWIPRTAVAVDRRLSAFLKSYRGRYLNQLLASVRDVELLGMATQGEFSLQLRHVYVDVSLAPSALQTTTHAPFVGPDTQAGERRSLESFLGGHQPRVFAVIGGPGSGKTTLLRRTVMTLGESGRHKRGLPVILYLRDHVQEIVRNPGVSIPELIASVTWLKGMVTADWFERCLTKGRCVVMLDGLDEVAVEEQRQLTSTWVQDQVARYPANHFILTSRPHGYHSNPVRGADVLQVRRFTSDQIFKFVHGWYYAIECRSTGETGERTRAIAKEHAADLLRRMRLQPALYDLAANPMLLTMIANVHKYRGALPGSRAALYGEMCDLLLHRRQEAKNLTAGSGLKAEQRAKVVRKLALAMMTREVRDVTRESASEIVGPTLARIPRAATAEVFLDELTKSGLFVEREVGMYAFAHQTLQEYLAAAEIRDHPEANVLASMVDKAWWRETILLWAANADASPVVAACLRSGTVSALALAFDCADEAREVDVDLVERLDALLYSEPAASDADAHRRLMAAVRASRSLRQTVTLSSGAVACARPFPQSLYRLYVDMSGDPDGSVLSPTEDDNAEAVGVSAAEVEKVVTWVNSLFDDGTTYRLPVRRELTDQLTGVVVDLTRRTVWYAEDPPAARPVEEHRYAGPRLYVPSGVKHPYVASADLLAETIRRDLRSVVGVLPYVLSLALERDLERARIHDFKSMLNRLDLLNDSRTPALVKDAIHVDRALARSRGGDLSQDRDLHRRVERIRDLARGLAEVTDFPVPPALVREFRRTLRRARAVDEAIGQALDVILTHSLVSDDVSMLVHELQDPALLPAAASGGRTVLQWAPPRIHRDQFELAVVALSLLLSLWDPHRTKYRHAHGWLQFERFLLELFSESMELSPAIPDEAEPVLRKLQPLLLNATWAGGSTFAGADSGRDEQCWRILARRVTVVSASMIAATVQNPGTPYSSSPAIRLGLLAAACVADRFTDPAIARSLRGLHSSLTCLDARRDDPTLPSEVLLLMRT
ncbi:NACHT domain-containing protein [Kribbella sp. NPDC004875]|uniref:NACHT domain-containing protein n=1 Tax=Kribbella sp. NPDC004875 TaxID=3364107 RepID=UPI00367B3FE0